MYFYEIYDDALLIATENRKGWVRTPLITGHESEAVVFSSGMVRLLRGDWRGAQRDFDNLLARSDMPQELRVHALLYRGLVKEKAGNVGRAEFETAYRLNPLDRSAAAYLLMSRLADISRLQADHQDKQLGSAWNRLQQTLDATRPLFPADDPWIKEIDKLSR
jgi:hypothetical protein